MGMERGEKEEEEVVVAEERKEDEVAGIIPALGRLC
jgi:hypothetical protein